MTTAAFPTPRGSSHAGRPSLLARYRSLPDVRDAIEGLESAGIDGDDLALVGEAALQTERGTERTVADRRILERASLALAVGVLAGAVAGAVVGAALLAITFAIWTPPVEPGWVFGLVTAWFASAGSLFGAFVAMSRHTGFSESWPLTFADEPGEPLWLAVYAPLDEARPAVEATGAVEMLDGTGVEATRPPGEPGRS
jgi:hypothetical protein